jgi:hypothetical protein
LKPDGVLALTTPNVVSLFRRLLLDWHPVKLLKVLRGSCRLGSAIEAARLAERGLGLKLVGVRAGAFWL